MPVAWARRICRRLQAWARPTGGGAGGRRSRVASRLLRDVESSARRRSRRDGGSAAVNGRRISEADLHAYVDGALEPQDRLGVEEFLAAHPPIARRVEAYRSQLVAVNSAFKAGEAPLPPPLAELSMRYARAVSSSAVVGAALGIAGLIAVLCLLATGALGAYG